MKTPQPVQHVVVRRLEVQRGRRSGWIIRGEWIAAADAPDVEVVAGPVTSYWWDVPLPPCPDCGGDLVWYEAGYVPGARRCMGAPISRDEHGPAYAQDGGCGSMFSVSSPGA
jgi:hypothetical protein